MLTSCLGTRTEDPSQGKSVCGWAVQSSEVSCGPLEESADRHARGFWMGFLMEWEAVLIEGTTTFNASRKCYLPLFQLVPIHQSFSSWLRTLDGLEDMRTLWEHPVNLGNWVFPHQAFTCPLRRNRGLRKMCASSELCAVLGERWYGVAWTLWSSPVHPNSFSLPLNLDFLKGSIFRGWLSRWCSLGTPRLNPRGAGLSS